MILAAIGVTGGIVASAVVNTMAKRRERAIWEVVNENRRQLNRIQTARKWRVYGKAFNLEKRNNLVSNI